MLSRILIDDFHPVRNPIIRMNGVCPYFTMYPLPFPYEKLSQVDKPARVLDPFCGRGTTNFAARLLEIESVGIDSNPVAAAVTMAKFCEATAEEVFDLCLFALDQTSEREAPRGEFWSTCYHPETLAEICAIRSYFLGREELTEVETILRAIILGILHGPLTKGKPSYLSNQMPRTYSTKPEGAVSFWKNEKMKPFYVPVAGAVWRRSAYLLKNLPKAITGNAILGDSRNPDTYSNIGEFDFVITSPPYLGMNSYWPDQWLRNWFLGGSDYVEYSKPDQIQSQYRETFIRDLAMVWRNAANVCRNESTMIIRFGALPSYATEPSLIIKESIKEADSGWEITRIKSAGFASEGKRQADQFKTKNGKPINEVDVYCSLNN